MVNRVQLPVCLVTLNFSPETTGIGPYSARLAAMLVESGVEVQVVTALPHYPSRLLYKRSDQALRDERKVTRVWHYAYTGSNILLRFVSEVSFGVCAWWAVRKNEYESVVAVSPSLVGSYIFVILRLAFGNRRSRLVVWVQDLYGSASAEVASSTRSLNAIIRFVEGRFLRRADKLVVIHEGFRDAVVTNYAVEHARIIVQRNWSRWGRINVQDADVARLRHAFGWDGKKVVLHAGNIGAKQSVETLVRAAMFAQTHLSSEDLLFVAMGDGNKRNEIEKQSDHLANFQLLNPVDESDFFSVLRAADILVICELASMVSASLPSKLVSYFNAGRPVLVSSNDSGLTWREANRSAVCVHVAPESGEDLAVVSAAVARDLAFRTHCESRGPEFAISKFSETAAAASFMHALSGDKEQPR